MEILVKQITKEIDEKRKTFFLDEKGIEFQLDWVEARYENIGYKLKENSQFNNKGFIYKGRCKLKAADDTSGEFDQRHVFVEKQTKNRYYLNSEEFEANFEKVIEKKADK